MRSARVFLFTLGCLAVMLWAPMGLAWAEQTYAAKTTQTTSPSFKAAPATDDSSSEPSPWAVGAYAALFVGVFGYVIFVASQQTKIAGHIADLAEHVNQVEQKTSA